MTWLKFGQKTRFHLLLCWSENEELWCTDSIEGLGFLSHQYLMSCSRSSISSVLAQGQDVVLGVTLLLSAAIPPPVGHGLAGARCPSSHKHQYFFWTFLFSTSYLSSLFCYFAFFPTFRFCDPFLMARPLSPFFPCESPVRVHHSCRSWLQGDPEQWKTKVFHDSDCLFPSFQILQAKHQGGKHHILMAAGSQRYASLGKAGRISR